jgi:hypothetical protein
MADARAQADAIAKAAGVTITGVLSVSASSGATGFPVPMGAVGTGGAVGPSTEAPDRSSGTEGGGSTGAGTGASTGAPGGVGTAPAPAPTAGPIDFGMSVTVAYSIGG